VTLVAVGMASAVPTVIDVAASVLVVGLHAHEIERPELDARLGPQTVGESLHALGLALQHDALQGVVVIEMDEGRGRDQIVMVVLQLPSERLL
jgi:hypothetical protein